MTQKEDIIMLHRTNGKRVYTDYEARFYTAWKQKMYSDQKAKGPQVERYKPDLKSIRIKNGKIVIDMVRVG
jgi:hypothetical protein